MENTHTHRNPEKSEKDQGAHYIAAGFSKLFLVLVFPEEATETETHKTHPGQSSELKVAKFSTPTFLAKNIAIKKE